MTFFWGDETNDATDIAASTFFLCLNGRVCSGMRWVEEEEDSTTGQGSLLFQRPCVRRFFFSCFKR